MKIINIPSNYRINSISNNFRDIFEYEFVYMTSNKKEILYNLCSKTMYLYDKYFTFRYLKIRYFSIHPVLDCLSVVERSI